MAAIGRSGVRRNLLRFVMSIHALSVSACGVAAFLSLASTAAFAQATATRSSSFAYDAATGQMTREVVEPNTSALRLQTDYTFDAFGNRITATVSGADIATRGATTTYDAQGRFRVSASNALGHSETWQYDPRFGKPVSHTGPNGLTTTWSYDSFGRQTLETRPDGTQTKIDYIFCDGINGGSATCPTGAAFLVQSTPLAADGATPNGPVIIVYLDTLEREIARDSQGFDTSAIRTSKEYDALGRTQRQSRPYFVSSGTPQWTVFTYDKLDRVLTETAPDSSVTQFGYSGLVTTVTNALNQLRTTRKDSLGQTVAITDALSHTITYLYDPFGNLVQTTDVEGNVVTATFDVRGRKIAGNDPNLGAWTYSYNALDELVSQTDAKSQTSTLAYDTLGRMTQRVEPDMTSVWTYDTAANGIGKLATTGIAAGQGAGYQRSYVYDARTRPTQVVTTIGGTAYAISGTYDGNGRIKSVTYPSGLSVNYVRTALGDVQSMWNAATSQLLWTARAFDAEMRLTEQRAGNNVTTRHSFNPANGQLTGIQAGTGNTIANFSYSYDALGNLLTRSDANTNLSETLVYDPLNRLTSSTVALAPTPLVRTLTYSPVGNLLSKTDVGTYTYPAAGSARPHAVSSIAGGTLTTAFSYDANGNQTAGLGRTVSYSASNHPVSITQGTRTVGFSLDPDGQRFAQTAPEGTTLYFEAFGVRAELLAGNQWTEYLSVGGTMIGARFSTITTATVMTRYFHLDHLGSVAILTDETGAIVQRGSFDAWGKRRLPSGADDPSGGPVSQTTRGFTGQEHLAEVGLIHFNARLYDPRVGRFTSADSIVPHPGDAQSFNRYSYVRNRPLSAVDPSGHADFSSSGATSGSVEVWIGPGQGYAIGYWGNIPTNPYTSSIPGIPASAVGNPIQYMGPIEYLKYQAELRQRQRLLYSTPMTRPSNYTPVPASPQRHLPSPRDLPPMLIAI